MKPLRLSRRQKFSLDSSPGHRPGTGSVPTDKAKAKSHRLLETLLLNKKPHIFRASWSAFLLSIARPVFNPRYHA
jgi:hypothetical protein